jgi:hypothetical protein
MRSVLQPSAGSSSAVTADRPCLRLGLVVSPVVDEDPARALREELAEELAELHPEVAWQVDLVRERLREPPAHLTELVDAARARLRAEDWDLVVHVTELPLRLSRRPLLSHASPTHGVALVSLPALGVIRRDRRLRDAVARSIRALIGAGGAHEPGSGALLRARRRGLEAEIDEEGEGIFHAARVIGGNLALLGGMIRANHPWRLALGLAGALAGALGAAALTMILADVWRLAAALPPTRLAILTLASIATAVITAIVAHDLWERPATPQLREQATLFNVATLATIFLGFATLYVAVGAAVLAVGVVLIDSTLFADAIGRPAAADEYLRLAWLVASLATVGGAIGGALESDAAVREAAYARLPKERSAEERVLDRAGS